MNIRVVWSVIVMLCCPLAMQVKAGVMSFDDGTFNDANWSAELGFFSGTNITFTGEQVASGGTPGQFRRTTHNWTGQGGLNVAHLNSTAVFNPAASGAISKIDFSFDLNWLNAPNGPGAVAYSLLLRQNGTLYTAGYSLVTDSVWTQVGVTSLVASNFGRHEPIGSGGINPDFSASGSVIELGYLTSNGTQHNESVTTVSGIDNWSVDVHTTNTVPEPSTFATLSILAIIGLATRHRSRRA